MRTLTAAIVGRPNVGKTTLFNALLGERKGIVDAVPELTRDRNYAFVERFAVDFFIIDTGGYIVEPTDPLADAVREQTLLAIEEADTIICVFDCADGPSPIDYDVVELIRRSGKPVLYVVNKCDGPEHEHRSFEFFRLGIEQPSSLSALGGYGMRDFVQELIRTFPDYEQLALEKSERKQLEAAREEEAALEFELHQPALAPDEEDEWIDDLQRPAVGSEGMYASDGASSALAPRSAFAPVYVPGVSHGSVRDYDATYRVPLRELGDESYVPGDNETDEGDEVLPSPEASPPRRVNVAIVGRPNVGKSTLLNTLLGKKRAITSPLPGTTRDLVDDRVVRDGQEFIFTDTAGLRKKARVSDTIERYSTVRTLRALEDCDVAIVVLDGTREFSEQDAKILGVAHERGRGVIIVVNKWDVKSERRSQEEVRADLRERFKFAPYAPVLFISAKSGRHCPALFDLCSEVAAERLRRVSTGRLNQVLTRALADQTLATYRGRKLKLHFAAQVSVAPPKFLLFFSQPRAVHFSLLRQIKNIIRQSFGFHGTDIKLATRKC